MKFNAILAVAAFAAATTHAAAVEEADFAELDAYLANINTAAVAAAQSSIQAGAQPTADASTPSSPAESSQAAALAAAGDDGLPSEADIDKLIASAAAQFGTAGAGLALPPAAAVETQATARDANVAAAAQATGGASDAAIEAIKGAVAAAYVVKNVFAQAPGVAAATGAVAATGAAAPTAAAVAEGGSNSTVGNQVWLAAAPRDAVSGLAVAGMIAAYFL